ncbi:hypothetical protein Ancab_013657 [Ancistrocladus abbreviatus]
MQNAGLNLINCFHLFAHYRRAAAGVMSNTGLLVRNESECSAKRKKSLRARYCYGVIFLLINLNAWLIRDYGQRLFPHSHYLKACGIEGLDCLCTMGVLRVSFGCFVSILSISYQNIFPFDVAHNNQNKQVV